MSAIISTARKPLVMNDEQVRSKARAQNRVNQRAEEAFQASFFKAEKDGLRVQYDQAHTTAAGVAGEGAVYEWEFGWDLPVGRLVVTRDMVTDTKLIYIGTDFGVAVVTLGVAINIYAPKRIVETAYWTENCFNAEEAINTLLTNVAALNRAAQREMAKEGR